jgi:pimeloyl-ACP methyl ester carboxylesterase
MGLLEMRLYAHRVRARKELALTIMQAHAMNQHPATLLALLFVSFLLLRLLLRLSLAAFYDTALTLHLLVRLRIRPVTVRLPGPDGTTMRVWCPASPSSKPPLLLLHGFGGDAKWTWVGNFAALSRSFHVYAPDLVFFGSSSRSASPLRSVAFQARCSADAMRILGVPHYHIAGISYGGFVAYRMAAVEARECVGRLVIMTSAVAASAQEITALAAREEIAVEDALMPETAAGLRRLLCRIMHSPPRLPDFLLLDLIQVQTPDSFRYLHLRLCFNFPSSLSTALLVRSRRHHVL